jgi:hypothetical protein
MRRHCSSERKSSAIPSFSQTIVQSTRSKSRPKTYETASRLPEWQAEQLIIVSGTNTFVELRKTTLKSGVAMISIKVVGTNLAEQVAHDLAHGLGLPAKERSK